MDLNKVIIAFRAQAHCNEYECIDCPANGILCGKDVDKYFEEIADDIEELIKTTDSEKVNLRLAIIRLNLSLYKKSKELSKNNKDENEKRKKFHRQIVSQVIKDETLLVEEIERLKRKLKYKKVVV